MNTLVNAHLTLEEELEDAQIAAEAIKDKFFRDVSTIEDAMDALGPEDDSEEYHLAYNNLDNTQTATEKISDDAEDLYDEITDAIDSLHDAYELVNKLRDLQKEVELYKSDLDHIKTREQIIGL